MNMFSSLNVSKGKQESDNRAPGSNGSTERVCRFQVQNLANTGGEGRQAKQRIFARGKTPDNLQQYLYPGKERLLEITSCIQNYSDFEKRKWREYKYLQNA